MTEILQRIQPSDIPVDEVLSTLAVLHSSGTVESLLSIRDQQDRIQPTLDAVQRRLKTALDLAGAEVVPFPMY
jgi:hypothetical protein